MADVSTLWDDVLFDEAVDGPWDDGVIAVSPTINNQNNAYNSLDITLHYTLLDPDGAYVQVGSEIAVVIEEKVEGDLWVPVAQQGRDIKGLDQACNYIIRVKPGTIVDPAPIGISQGSRIVTWISSSEGSLASETRVKLLRLVNDSSRPLHTKVQLTAVAREYDTQ